MRYYGVNNGCFRDLARGGTYGKDSKGLAIRSTAEVKSALKKIDSIIFQVVFKSQGGFYSLKNFDSILPLSQGKLREI